MNKILYYLCFEIFCFLFSAWSYFFLPLSFDELSNWEKNTLYRNNLILESRHNLRWCLESSNRRLCAHFLAIRGFWSSMSLTSFISKMRLHDLIDHLVEFMLITETKVFEYLKHNRHTKTNLITKSELLNFPALLSSKNNPLLVLWGHFLG